MLFVIALAAAILCTIASCSDLVGPAQEESNRTFAILNGTADGGFNGTVYRLGGVVIEVTVPVNASRLNLTLPEKVDNITLYDEAGSLVALNSSYRFWQGNSIYSLNFERHVQGMLAYNLTSQGQQFVISTKEKGPVRVILPQGYATGDRLLGLAWPPPDEIGTIEGKSALTWNNTTKLSYIEVNYYRDNAPVALTVIISILALAAIALLIEYYFSIKKLRALRLREEEEKEKVQ
jgi:hypothetical protein